MIPIKMAASESPVQSGVQDTSETGDLIGVSSQRSVDHIEDTGCQHHPAGSKKMPGTGQDRSHYYQNKPEKGHCIGCNGGFF